MVSIPSQISPPPLLQPAAYSNSLLSPLPSLLIIVLDGVGISNETNLSCALAQNSEVLPATPFIAGNAVNAAFTPNLAQLLTSNLSCTLKAHGSAVGLPSEDDMGNSEVGHNAIGAGRIFAQGARLVNEAIESGALFQSQGWQKTVLRNELCTGQNTLHLCGLLSDGNVHSHINHLLALIKNAKNAQIKRVRLHILLDGRDVSPLSALTYVETLENFINNLRCDSFDIAIASGGGRMNVTMDRYESDWRIVELGYKAHVLGEGMQFETAKQAIETLRQGDKVTDQFLPAFVIAKNTNAIGKVADGDSFILFNFRGDRAIQISRALTEQKFDAFQRKIFPKIHFAGMMQYDGDLHIPGIYLVEPPAISNTMGELLAVAKKRQFACSETQKFGHVTFFWNGNRSGKFDDANENYIEIKSDLLPFQERPWMKSAEIADVTIAEMKKHSFDVGRINFANGDMIGHTGDFAASVLAVAATDLALGRIMKAALETNTMLIVTADHGNADEIFERDKKSGQINFEKNGNPKLKTSHTLAPVPFCIFNAEAFTASTGKKITLNTEIKTPGLANIAATVMHLSGFNPPKEFESSLIHLAKATAAPEIQTNKKSNLMGHQKTQLLQPQQFEEAFALSIASSQFYSTVQALRMGCPWDKVQTFASLQPFLVEESYEAVHASQELVAAQNSADVKTKAVDFCDELGDVTLQIFLNACIASETKLFNATDVLKSINAKMIFRHPHVFEPLENKNISSADDVVVQWDKLKSLENSSQKALKSTSLLQKAFKKRALPTLNYGAAVSKQSFKHGFAWNTLEGTFGDLDSEVAELKEELFAAIPNISKIADEIGDVAYTLCNIIVYLNSTLSQTEQLDLDILARAGIEKFVVRFLEMEKIRSERNGPLTETSAKNMSLDAWNALWSEAKKRKYK